MSYMNIVRNYARQIIAETIDYFGRQARHAEIEKMKAAGMLTIGKHTYGTPKVWIYKGSEAKVIIGSFCSIAPGVQIITGGIHPLSWVSTFPFRIKFSMPDAYLDGMPETRGDIVIGSDVWIGTDVMILSGVNIGDGTIVSAGSLVTRSFPAYAIIGGSPAKIIKYRYSEDIVNKLLSISWWNWEDSKIREAVPLLSSNNIVSFLDMYSSDYQKK